MKIVEIGTGYTGMPAKIGAATEIVAYNLFLSFKKKHNVGSALLDITFEKETYGNDEKMYIYIPKKYNKIDDKGYIHVLRRLLYSWKLALYLRSLIKKNDQDLTLHFHNQFNFFLFYVINRLIIKNHKIQTAFTVHSSSWSFENKVPAKLFLERFSIKKADKVIAITTAIKRTILLKLKTKKKFFSQNIFAIHNGVNTETYFPLNKTVKKRQFINVGSVCDRKNQLGTIKLLEGFLKDHSYKFVFAGKIIDPAYLQTINDHIEAGQLEKYVEYLGEIEPGEALNKAYNESQAYISSSKMEAGLSLVVLEALSSGLPVFLSEDFSVSLADFPNLPDTIKPTYGFNFRQDLENIALADNEIWDTIQQTSRQFILDYLSWDAIAEEHYKAFIS